MVVISCEFELEILSGCCFQSNSYLGFPFFLPPGPRFFKQLHSVNRQKLDFCSLWVALLGELLLILS